MYVQISQLNHKVEYFLSNIKMFYFFKFLSAPKQYFLTSMKALNDIL